MADFTDFSAKQLHLNKELMRAGFVGLDNPRELLDQIACTLDGHEDFRRLLVTIPPEHRADCYESLKHRLRFEPKPLQVYVREATNAAIRQGQPFFDHETGMIYEQPSGGEAVKPAKQLIEVAEKAIAGDYAKGSLKVVCARCLDWEIFPAMNRREALKAAGRLGWARDTKRKEEICPKCAKARMN